MFVFGVGLCENVEVGNDFILLSFGYVVEFGVFENYVVGLENVVILGNSFGS